MEKRADQEAMRRASPLFESRPVWLKQRRRADHTIGIGLAAVGLLNPLLAAFIHVASELTFILNSTRLLPPRERNKAASQEQATAQA